MKLAALLPIIGVAVVGVTALTLRAHACLFLITDLWDGVIAAGQQRDLPPIPRNAAFVWSHGDPSGKMPQGPVVVAVDSTSQAITGRVLMAIGNRRGTFIAKPDEPMPPHFAIQSGSTQLTTGDSLDEVAPAAPQILDSRVYHDDSGEGCGGDATSCAGATSLDVTLSAPAKDAQLPAGRVAYLVYLERSADEARTTRTPFALVSELGTINATTLSVQLNESWVDSDAFVSVSAIDWAANESPRTEPYQANSGGVGCAVSWPRKHRPKFAIGLAMLAGLAWMRRRKRRRSYFPSQF